MRKGRRVFLYTTIIPLSLSLLLTRWLSEDEDMDFVSEGLLGGNSVLSGSKLKAECQTLTLDELLKKMFEIVDEVNAVFQVRMV